MLAERVVEYLELSEFEIDEADQVLRRKPRPLHRRLRSSGQAIVDRQIAGMRTAVAVSLSPPKLLMAYLRTP